ncbi:hypothetical protein JOB18_040899 [Solea senegalensis]|uniref:Uncharacterized protein n=1 Tax=Solea senegalensis TaxID=28829 RepID=A0AAV6PD86_SOLSE|nr:hypothetical protein JOB18_040899 [Solea senegalensis]
MTLNNWIISENEFALLLNIPTFHVLFHKFREEEYKMEEVQNQMKQLKLEMEAVHRMDDRHCEEIKELKDRAECVHQKTYKTAKQLQILYMHNVIDQDLVLNRKYCEKLINQEPEGPKDKKKKKKPLLRLFCIG